MSVVALKHVLMKNTSLAEVIIEIIREYYCKGCELNGRIRRCSICNFWRCSRCDGYYDKKEKLCKRCKTWLCLICNRQNTIKNQETKYDGANYLVCPAWDCGEVGMVVPDRMVIPTAPTPRYTKWKCSPGICNTWNEHWTMVCSTCGDTIVNTDDPMTVEITKGEKIYDVIRKRMTKQRNVPNMKTKGCRFWRCDICTAKNRGTDQTCLNCKENN